MKIESKFLDLCLERDKVLNSSEFSRSPIMSKLLQFLIDRKISGDDRSVSAYELAVDCLGRPESFDPTSDSYVRVQMGRLRKLLTMHYLLEPSEPQILIPSGEYKIEFTTKPDGKSADIPDTKEDPSTAGIQTSAMVGDAGNMGSSTASNDGGWREKASSSGLAKMVAGIALIAVLTGLVVFSLSNAPPPQALKYPRLVIQKTATAEDERAVAQQILGFFQSRFYLFEHFDIVVANSTGTATGDYLFTVSVADTKRTQINLKLERSEDGHLL